MTSALDVAALILARMGPLDSWKLQKLVYYSQAWHLALRDEPLFAESIEAWKDGPVVRELWDVHRGKHMVRDVRGGDARGVEHQQTMLVDLVCDHYGTLSGAELSALTHDERPWKQARRGLAGLVASRRLIELGEMGAFYRHERRLGGRAAADLIAGEFWLSPEDVADPMVSAQLVEIRDDFRKAGHAPDQDGVVSAQFESAPVHPTVARERGRTRPVRSGGRA